MNSNLLSLLMSPRNVLVFALWIFVLSSDRGENGSKSLDTFHALVMSSIVTLSFWNFLTCNNFSYHKRIKPFSVISQNSTSLMSKATDQKKKLCFSNSLTHYCCQTLKGIRCYIWFGCKLLSELLFFFRWYS